MLSRFMAQKNVTKYRLSKDSGIPYSTLTDICTGKTALSKCSAETVYKLAKGLGVSMEALLEPHMLKRSNFELFKSHVCHKLKELGDTGFIIETLEQDDIQKYYQRGWYPESLYLLAMLDYVSRENGIPLCTRYDALRSAKLETTLYPSSVLAIAFGTGNNAIKQEAIRDSIPEFIRFNIVESEVRNVL